MKIKREVIIVTISVITVIICVALTRISNMQTPTSISSETYIGVMATLIGVCATIIVGFQIAHFLELRDLRDQIDELNKVRGEFRKISTDESKIALYVVPTNEELMIAMDTYNIIVGGNY